MSLPFAMQLAIVIDNVTLAFLEVVQFGVAGAAVSGLAVCLKVVTIDTNSVARLRVRSCWPVALIGAASDTAISASYALQVAVFIDDLSATFLKIVQLGIFPVAARGWAASFKIVTVCVHILAGLRVRATGKPRSNSAAFTAPQSALVIDDVAAATLHVAQQSALPASRGILAIRRKDVIVKINVPAGLLI